MQKGERIKALPAPIKFYTGRPKVNLNGKIPILKKHQYCVRPEKISGDAPKDFISVYEYGKCNKSNNQKWINYIAKVGHKRYPSESITEHLLTRLGEIWGFKMAKSKLYIVTGQIRFCSEYFLNKKNQRLIHGADILAAHLREGDATMIEAIDENGWSQELLTLQFVKQAIEDIFPHQAKNITIELVELLLFDAIVGNNDRHFFNWGVVKHLSDKHEPYFSPIYDSARGLFWNITDEYLLSLVTNQNKLNDFLVKYHKSNRPKIGWEFDNAINHVQMVQHLIVNDHCSFEKARKLFSLENIKKAEYLLNTEFKYLISDIRKEVIIRYLIFRFREFSKIINT